MNICVIGTGYVGLVTGTVFSDLGNDVICVDTAKEKIDLLKQAVMPIYEPGLEEMVKRNIADKRLEFTTDLESSIKASEIIFICVGTPPQPNGETDLSYVEDVAKTIGIVLNGYKIIVNKSTVPVGTGDFVSTIIERYKKGDTGFDVVSNPEFLREGSAISDSLSPDRIVIGAPSKKVAMRFLELYATLGKPIIITDVYSAEMIKYASNAFLATKISFINAIANICESAGANVIDVAKGVGLDFRIGKNFLNAGLGFGGSCFPKDVQSLIHTAHKFNYDFSLLKAVMDINDERVKRFTSIIKEKMDGVSNKKIGILGLAFKPDTDDIREAKSIEIIEELLNEGAYIRAYDPVAVNNTKKIFPDITYCQSSYEAADGADAIVLVTEWREFQLLNFARLKDSMKRSILFDGRNMYDPERIKSMGFEYYGIGRT